MTHNAYTLKPKNLLLPVALLLIFWFTRLPALESLPLHNDEGLHLSRAVQVWNLKPFWEIRDGKIINHWVIAALYPQSSPAFIGRIATVLVVMIGVAAGFALARREFGVLPAAFVIWMWSFTPYLFFYERLAFSDAEAGALALAAIWAALRLTRTGKIRDALLTGVILGSAVLFKFTAVPAGLSVALIMLLLARYPIRRRITLLIVVGAVVAALFAVPVGYLLLRHSSLFDIALGWISGGDGGGSARIGVVANAERFVSLLYGFNGVVWLAIMAGGIVSLIVYRRTRGLVLTAAVLIPPLSMILLAREVLPRHFVAALPALIILGVGALSAGHHRRTHKPRFDALDAAVFALLFVTALPFMYAAVVDPSSMPLPDSVRAEHITEHSAGYGLREAVQAFPQIVPADVPIVGSMFPDGCRRANFYAISGRDMICTDAPGVDTLRDLFSSNPVIYVLTDTAPLIGIDWSAYADEFSAERIATYPRPGIIDGSTDVVLWRVTRLGD